MTRRIVPFIILTVLASLMVTACSSTPQRKVETEFLLGTTVSVTTYGRVADRIFESVFARVLAIEQQMSTTEEDYDDTELLRVNRAAGVAPVQVSADTWYVVDQAVSYSRESTGAFDVTVGPLVALWGIGSSSPMVPGETTLQAALDAVDYASVRLNQSDQTIFLPRPGMGIDVGGIAKGYAADEAAAILRDEGVESALLDFGGNILVVGAKPDGTPWRIGIQVPDAARGDFLGIVELTDRAVVTSGTYERFFEQDGVRYHHILDTVTGFPVDNGLLSVTIVTDESMRADALSTAVFALGLEEGIAFVESRDDVEAALVTSDLEVHLTSGMQEYFTLTNEDFRLAD